MAEAFTGNAEMKIVLPLGVVANQLMRIESDIRLLNMKAFRVAQARDNRHHTQLIDAKLESINASLDAIRQLVAEFGADIHPPVPAAPPKRGFDRDD